MIVWSTSGFQLFVLFFFSFPPNNFGLTNVELTILNIWRFFLSLTQLCNLWHDGVTFQHHLVVQQDPPLHQGTRKRHLPARLACLLIKIAFGSHHPSSLAHSTSLSSPPEPCSFCRLLSLLNKRKARNRTYPRTWSSGKGIPNWWLERGWLRFLFPVQDCGCLLLFYL